LGNAAGPGLLAWSERKKESTAVLVAFSGR
jgi:hypothetical protein